MRAKELSSRERQVLLLSGSGLSDQQIAERMELSPATVRTYWKRIRSKHSRLSRSEIILAEGVVSGSMVVREQRKATDDLLVEMAHRKRLESSLGIFRAAFDVAPHPQILINPRGCLISYANTAFLELTKFESAELVGAPWDGFLEVLSGSILPNEPLVAMHSRKGLSPAKIEAKTLETGVTGSWVVYVNPIDA